jgi:predicted membrane protein
MKFAEFTRTMSPLEIALLILFIIYIIFPVQTPSFLAASINTPISLVVIFIVTLYLFFYTHPVIGVIYIFVAYELLRRSSLKVGQNVLLQFTPSESVRSQEMVQMNPAPQTTLEEQIVAQMAPSSQNYVKVDGGSDFQPIAEKIVGASLY